MIKINGLNIEQVNYIMINMLNSGFKAETSDDILEYVREDYNCMIDTDTKRHWTDGTAITQIGDRWFGFHEASCDGDMSAYDKGFVPEDWVYEMEEYEIIKTSFRKKNGK